MKEPSYKLELHVTTLDTTWQAQAAAGTSRLCSSKLMPGSV